MFSEASSLHHGRVAHWQSAALTWQRSKVQFLLRLPLMSRSSTGRTLAFHAGKRGFESRPRPQHSPARWDGRGVSTAAMASSILARGTNTMAL